MRNVLWFLTLALVVLMPTQWAFRVGAQRKTVSRIVTETAPDGSTREVERTDVKLEGGAHVTPGDALLAAVFLAWAATAVVTFRLAEIRWPILAVFVFLAAVLASVLHSQSPRPGLRELLQLGAYFVGGWLVFGNCIDTRPRLKVAADLFSVVVAAVVLIALFQYKQRSGGLVFGVCGTFANRNTLGAFLAVSLPFVFALALYETRLWGRFALMLTVGIGAAVTLSGGALIAIAAALLFVAAVKSRAALVGVLLAVLLAVTIVVPFLPPRHSETVVCSVRPFLDGNALDHGRKLDRRERTVTAARYKRWDAAVRLIRRHLRPPFLGVGPGRFNEAVGSEYGDVEKPEGDTDDVRGFNVTAAEPDTFNMYLVTAAESGPVALVALAWILFALLGGNVREHGRCGDDTGRALALGGAGAVVGAALCAVFSNVLVRGVAMPFIFAALSGILWARLPARPARRP